MFRRYVATTKLRSQIFLITMGILVGVLVMYIFTGKGDPRVEVSHNMIVEKIESMGNLEVVKYSIQDIMEYKKERPWYFPNAKTALIVSGEVIGCIDLTNVTPADIYTAGDSIRLRLPAPEICHVKIDHNKSRVYNIENGLWESAEIVDEAYRHAEKQLNEEALRLDFETQARDNAVNLLRPLLQTMGFKHVSIMFGSSPKEYGGL